MGVACRRASQITSLRVHRTLYSVASLYKHATANELQKVANMAAQLMGAPSSFFAAFIFRKTE